MDGISLILGIMIGIACCLLGEILYIEREKVRLQVAKDILKAKKEGKNES